MALLRGPRLIPKPRPCCPCIPRGRRGKPGKQMPWALGLSRGMALVPFWYPTQFFVRVWESPPRSYLVVPTVRGFWEDKTGDQPNLVALRGQRCLNKVSLCGLSSCEIPSTTAPMPT